MDVDAGQRKVFSKYRCTSIPTTVGKPHPGDIAEPASLRYIIRSVVHQHPVTTTLPISAVSLPPSTYPLLDALPPALVQQGALSRLQLEGVLYACTKHLQLLPTGQRAGFFIADGAGVGKGRQIAAIILDNYARGRRRHVWLSISTDLYLDACRDLGDLGCEGINVINNCQTLDAKTKALGLSKDFQEGVLFMYVL